MAFYKNPDIDSVYINSKRTAQLVFRKICSPSDTLVLDVAIILIFILFVLKAHFQV